METYCRYRALYCFLKSIRNSSERELVSPSTWKNQLSLPWKLNISKRNVSPYGKPLLQGRRFCHSSATDGFKRLTPPWRVLFFGSDEFSVFTLESLNKNRLQEHDRAVDVLEVVTKPGTVAFILSGVVHKKYQQSVSQNICPVRQYAVEKNLDIHSWPIKVPVQKYDVGVVVSFGHLLPKKLIESFPYGILNVHPSLLPKWRGAAPLVHTILNGDAETGVSITAVRPKRFDVGPVFLQEKIRVPHNCTTCQLRDTLGPLGARMLVKSLKDLPTLEKNTLPQPEQNITYAKKIVPEMTWVNWKNQSKESISRQYRALHHMFPLRCLYGDITVKLLDMVDIPDEIDESILYFHGDEHVNLPPGTPCYGKKSEICWIKCKGGWVGFRRLGIKKEMSAKSFNNGYLQNSLFKDVMFSCHSNQSEDNIVVTL